MCIAFMIVNNYDLLTVIIISYFTAVIDQLAAVVSPYMYDHNIIFHHWSNAARW